MQLDGPAAALDSVTLRDVFTFGCSGVMVFGGVVPYIPQYRDIQRTMNAEGFSLYVCLALLIANTLRILFWFGHPFELPLLIQSIIMNVTMLSLVHLCVHVKNKYVILKAKDHLFTDFDRRFFWDWSDFLSYIEFMITFTAAVGLLVYLMLDNSKLIETIGFMAVLVEALLGVPQFYRNYVHKSTIGMSKKMVFMWTFGDIFKTSYFILREAPIQFWVCGFLQVGIDISILLQIFIYRGPLIVRTKLSSTIN